MNQMNKKEQTGFTLIEILVVMGLIAILAAIVIIAINPARQFAQARNTQRSSNVNAILNAIGQNMSDNKGVFTCATGAIPTTATKLASGAGNYDILNCIVPTYISQIPVDPSNGVACPASGTCTTYDTDYFVQRDGTSGRIIVNAPSAELSQAISVTR